MNLERAALRTDLTALASSPSDVPPDPLRRRSEVIDRATSVDALLADSRAAAGQLSPEQAAALLGRLASLQALLVERVVIGQVAVGNGRPSSLAAGPAASSPAWSEADLLNVKEAAAMLRVSPRWLYRHAKTLPFARKLSRKVLRFSRSGIARWLITRRYDSGAGPR